MPNRKSILVLFTLLVTGVASVSAAGVCVWSCQYNSNTDTWTYWFARTLSDCAAKDCLPRNGSSPSGTACSEGSPDIPGDCRDTETDGIDDWLIEGKGGELPPGLTPAADAKAALPCGTCGDASCSGKPVQGSCTSDLGLPGVCLAIFSGSHPVKCPSGGYQCACLD